MAWTAPEERFGRVDTLGSAAKKRIDQFPVIVKENSGQMRQYQEVVSELIGDFKEHKFVHELNSQIPEECVAKLPVRLCGRWAEFVEGKPKLSTWSSFASWLEKEAEISESKQWWLLQSTQFISRLITCYKSAKSLRECQQAKRRKLWRRTNFVCVVYHLVIV